MILFNCSSKHSMCLACFATMCTMQLSVNGFKNFPHMGFSISCPGPGQLISLYSELMCVFRR